MGLAAVVFVLMAAETVTDPRLIDRDPQIPHENYVDQPYVVITNDPESGCAC